jgi:phospholipase/carboxylesterase
MDDRLDYKAVSEPNSVLGAPIPLPASTSNHARGRLSARPRLSSQSERFDSPTPGLHAIGLGDVRDGCLYVPEKAATQTTSPLLVLFHGANGEATGVIQHFRAFADETGMMILAPESRKKTWDVVRGSFGEDLEFVDRALETIFSRYAIRTSHIAVGGFSDGASYALSLGIPNGSLFSHILAFSPGFVAPFEIDSTLRIFISHGTEDRVCAIDRCSRRIVPYLQRTGFDLQYVEFTGGHGIPEVIAREAVTWFLAPVADGPGF